MGVINMPLKVIKVSIYYEQLFIEVISVARENSHMRNKNDFISASSDTPGLKSSGSQSTKLTQKDIRFGKEANNTHALILSEDYSSPEKHIINTKNTSKKRKSFIPTYIFTYYNIALSRKNSRVSQKIIYSQSTRSNASDPKNNFIIKKKNIRNSQGKYTFVLTIKIALSQSTGNNMCVNPLLLKLIFIVTPFVLLDRAHSICIMF
jgi:hypothetical protein